MGFHHPSHQHAQHNDDAGERLGLAFALNVSFTVIEFIGGLLTNSTAIMADAVHDLGDSLSIGTAWLLNRQGQRHPDEEFTYGYRRLSLLGALINAVVLIAGSVWVLATAVPRLWQPEMPVAEGMLALAILGVVVNGFAAYRLSKGKTMNERVLNWHLLEDVLGWLAVLILSVVLLIVEWPILDPLLSIAFTLFILVNVVRSLHETLRLFIQAVPDKDLSRRIYQRLRAMPDIADAHHLHMWSLDGEHHVLTVHLVLAAALDPSRQQQLKREIAASLAEFELAHTTIELEFPNENCRDQQHRY